jgi:hypothetical protein
MAGHSNHAQNAAAWAAMRAEQAAAMEQRRAERAAEKAARREANRAAWWGRYGLEAPGAEQAAPVEQAAEAPEALEVPRCKVDQVAPEEWHVTTSDGTGYTVENAGYIVTIEGEAYTVPTLDAARELVELAEETRRDEADAVAVFVDGMRLECGQVVYTIEHATASEVRVRTEAAGAVKRQTLKLRRGPRGQFVKLHANSKAERTIYAADLAA